ncbi:MAG: amino acid permease [Gordonia sp. (in: high G+C Gram-positive bacteria)]|nr:MAG: amino acid permease [Gordonia sp. (in: high G+C Gram-positive bacteria)]
MRLINSKYRYDGATSASIFSVTLVVLYGQTRILFAIGRDGLLPERFAKVSPRTHTPVFNTIVVATIVGLLAGFIPLSSLWDLVSIGTLVAFIVVALAVIVLRVREPDLERGFKVPGYPVTPILSIAACIYILTGLHWTTYAWFLGWLAVVLTFYFLWSRHHSHLSPRSLGALVAGAGTLAGDPPGGQATDEPSTAQEPQK